LRAGTEAAGSGRAGGDNVRVFLLSCTMFNFTPAMLTGDEINRVNRFAAARRPGSSSKYIDHLLILVADSEAGVVVSSITNGGGKRRAFGISWQPVAARAR
jgi:hypothetical protein